MIQGSWLDTSYDEWTPEMHALIRKHGTGAGFGLLTNAAIFPHFDKRGPAAAVKETAVHRNQLAIGMTRRPRSLSTATLVQSSVRALSACTTAQAAGHPGS
jgi:hypothetical protein